MKINHLIALFCMLSMATFATADNLGVKKNINSYYLKLEKNIKNDKPFSLEKFITQNYRIAGSVSSRICQFIEKTTKASEKSRSFYILGVIKHPYCIKTLIKYLDFYNPRWSKPMKEIPMIGPRPAVQALGAIGPLCIPDICKEFLTTKNALRRHFCLQTIVEMFKGLQPEEKLDIIRLIVKRRIEKSSSSNKKQLLEELKNFKPGYDYNP